MLANQNIISLNRDGTINYHVYYESPGRSFLENLAVFASETFVYQMDQECATQPDRSQSRFSCGWEMQNTDSILAPRFQDAPEWGNYAYLYTKVPDAVGREGFSLVRLDKRDGLEAGRVWVDERRPEYLLDEPTGRVFVKVDDKEIVAFAFPTR